MKKLAKLIGSVSEKTSTNSYVTALKVGLTDLGYSTFLVHLKENNTNAIKFKILGSLDAATWETIKTETTLAKDGSVFETFSDPWLYVDVQFMANVPDAHGKLSVNISGT